MQKVNTKNCYRKYTSPFVETICLIDGEPRLLRYHNRRLNHTRKMIFGSTDFIDLADYIPKETQKGKQKLRVLYDETILSVKVSDYQINELQEISAVTIDPTFSYTYKSSDRNYFAQLLEEQNAQDLVLIQNNLITDTTFCNLIFSDGTRWLTPAQPLLEGCMRQNLIENHGVLPAIIRTEDLDKLISFKRINAMRSFEEAEETPISALLVNQKN